MEHVLIAFIVAAGIALALGIRWFVLWYFKIHELLEVLTEIRDRLPADARTTVTRERVRPQIDPPSAADRAFLAESATRPLPGRG